MKSIEFRHFENVPLLYIIVIDEIAVDEKNLVYVAVTRARKQVFLNPTVFKVLDKHEHFIHPSVEVIKKSSIFSLPYNIPF